MDIYLARHGQSMGNVDLTDDADPCLTNLGKRQVAALGTRLANHDFRCIFTSPLTRAVETAAAVVRARPDPNERVELFPLLMEVGTPAGHPGCPGAQIKALLPGAVPAEATEQFPSCMPAESGALQERQRMRLVVDYLFRRFPEDADVLLVTHGGFMERFLNELIGTPPDKMTSFAHVNAALTRITSSRNAAREIQYRIRFVNDTRHLPDTLLSDRGLADMYSIPTVNYR